MSDDDMTHDTEAGGIERPFTSFMLETKGKANWRSMRDTGTEILHVPYDTRLPEWVRLAVKHGILEETPDGYRSTLPPEVE